MTDIVKRLRTEGFVSRMEAADEIERLLAERDRLRKIVQDLLSVMPVLPVAAKHISGDYINLPVISTLLLPTYRSRLGRSG
jgi:hypothetical protein